MEHQVSLYGLFGSPPKAPESQGLIRVVTWNIRNPSLARARQQFDVLMQHSYDCLMLTEVKVSEGGLFLADALEAAGYHIVMPQNPHCDYVSLLAVRRADVSPILMHGVTLQHRAVAARLRFDDFELDVFVAYVPSRGPVKRRNIDKRQFQSELAAVLAKFRREHPQRHLLVGGDLNVIEPNHFPHYTLFGDWEYEFYESFSRVGMTDAFRLHNPSLSDHSWFGKLGDGYRFDHLFVSKELSQSVRRCNYDHQLRTSGLSDHSAMVIDLEIPSAESSGNSVPR